MARSPQELFAEIARMKPAERLRLAASMLDESNSQRDPRQARQLYEMAYSITTRTGTEMGAAMALLRPGRG